VEVYLGHLAEDEIEELGAVEAADLASKSNFSMTSRVSASKAAIQATEVACDLLGIREDAAERQRRGVVGLDAGRRLEDGVDVLDGAGESRNAGEDLSLGGLEDAVRGGGAGLAAG